MRVRNGSIVSFESGNTSTESGVGRGRGEKWKAQIDRGEEYQEFVREGVQEGSSRGFS